MKKATALSVPIILEPLSDPRAPRLPYTIKPTDIWKRALPVSFKSTPRALLSNGIIWDNFHAAGSSLHAPPAPAEAAAAAGASTVAAAKAETTTGRALAKQVPSITLS